MESNPLPSHNISLSQSEVHDKPVDDSVEDGPGDNACKNLNDTVPKTHKMKKLSKVQASKTKKSTKNDEANFKKGKE